jgi:flagellar motor protein MotB
MRPRTRIAVRREPIAHADDWLMTYADMITLLLCFFAVFLSISIARQDLPKAAPSAPAVTLPAHPATPTEARKVAPPPPATPPQHGDRPAETADHATPPKFEPLPPDDAPPTLTAVEMPEVRLAPTPAPAPPEAPPPPGPKGDRITILEMSSAAFFDSGSATLSDAGQAILRDAAAKLQSDEYKDYAITVEGHTDDTPIHTAQFPSNWELSTARAAAVVHFLLDQGISAQKLRAAGYADTFPKAPNRDANGNPIPANQALNRRVVIKLEKIEPDEPGAPPRP